MHFQEILVFTFAVGSIWPSILLAIAFHEFGHFLAAKLVRIDVFEIRLRSVPGTRFEGALWGIQVIASPDENGSIMHEHRDTICWWQDALVSIGGPAANLLICMIAIFLALHSG